MSPRGVAGILVAALLVLAAPLRTAAMYGFAPDLAPREYASPSGRFTLFVDPSNRDGAGEATYVLRKDGAAVWSGERPFTLWEAAVGDDGTVGGYAYTLGFNRPGDRSGDFLVVIIDAKGDDRVVERTEREPNGKLHSMADPKASGIFLDSANARVVVRVTAPKHAGSQWWIYPLGGGEPIRRPAPLEALGTWVLDARPVAGTDLVLVHVWKDAGDRPGGLFALLDPAFDAIWKLDLPGDYANGDASERGRIQYSIWKEGAILDTREPRRFSIRHAAAALRVTYEVEEKTGSSPVRAVREIARDPYDGPDRARAQAFPVVSLRKLGAIALDSARRDSPIRDVGRFAIDDRGNVGFLRCDGCEGEMPALVIVDANGAAVRTVGLPPGDEAVARQVAWLEGDRWLVTSSRPAEPATSSAVTVDARTGAATELAGFDAPEIKEIARDGAGGFVALTSLQAGAAVGEGLQAFDARGAPRWSISWDSAARDAISGARDVAVAKTGEVIVLAGAQDRLEIFGADGVHRHTIDLEEAWGRKPNYPSEIAADGSGGVAIFDSGGDPAVVRMNRQGQVVATFTPAFRDGRRFQPSSRIEPGPDGRSWASDGYALLRLGERGVVDRVLGEEPRTEALSDVAAMHVDPTRTIHAVDRRTGAVHVFDQDGAQLRVYRPAADDYEGSCLSPSLAVSDAGDVFVSRESGRAGRCKREFVHYAPDRGRVGVDCVGLDPIAEEWYSQPTTGNRWVVGFEKLWLVAPNRVPRRTIDRTASGQWLERPGPAAVAPDGSIALVSEAKPRDLMEPDAGHVVTIYGREGEAIRTWAAPDGILTWAGVAFDGTHFVALARGAASTPSRTEVEPSIAVLGFDANGAPQFRFDPPGASQRTRVFLVAAARGSELWIFDGERAIDRYALP
jgi:hypothetical protein